MVDELDLHLGQVTNVFPDCVQVGLPICEEQGLVTDSIILWILLAFQKQGCSVKNKTFFHKHNSHGLQKLLTVFPGILAKKVDRGIG